MAAGQRNIKARRKLSDLYKTGVEVRFGPNAEGVPEGKISGPEGFADPPGEHDVQVWVQPPSPLQREMALRDAQASRARALVRAKREEDSEEHLSILAFLADMGEETLVDYVLMQNMDTRKNEAQRDVLGDSKWDKIVEYQEAMRQFDEMPEEERDAEPEYQALMALDGEFGDQVTDRLVELTEAERDSLKLLGRKRLERKALERRAEIVGTQAFMSEYERQMLFYSVRDFENQTELFFLTARELAEQPDDFRNTIQEALLPYINDGSEAKNSLGAASGSESSEPPRKQETSAPSTPGDATE
jgi:hypothetical protein